MLWPTDVMVMYFVLWTSENAVTTVSMGCSLPNSVYFVVSRMYKFIVVLVTGSGSMLF